MNLSRKRKLRSYPSLAFCTRNIFPLAATQTPPSTRRAPAPGGSAYGTHWLFSCDDPRAGRDFDERNQDLTVPICQEVVLTAAHQCIDQVQVYYWAVRSFLALSARDFIISIVSRRRGRGRSSRHRDHWPTGALAVLATAPRDRLASCAAAGDGDGLTYNKHILADY